MVHLKPMANQYSFRWIFGEREAGGIENGFAYVIPEYSLTSFSVFVSVIEALRSTGIPVILSEKIDALLPDIRKNIEITEKSHGEGQTNFLASAVTYAIMRRISRESAYTSSIIDRGAKLLNELLHRKGFDRVVLKNVDFSDVLSLKIFGRAILINSRSNDWQWFFSSNVSASQMIDGALFGKIRHMFFSKLQSILEPQIESVQQSGHSNIRARVAPVQKEVVNSTLFSISKELVLQNYDFCILACTHLINHNKDNEVVAEAHRIAGLALTNFGLIDAACKQFELAEKLTGNTYKKAHISYLQGLSAAKRHYSLELSEKHYQRGLNYLDSVADEDIILEQLERAWIFNGIAMNQVLRNKKNGHLSNYRETFDLLISAFTLVRDGGDPAREYLRFNLIANMGFLMEIYKNYGYSIRLFEQTFDNNLYEASAEKFTWNFVMNYRIGLLKYKLGDFQAANHHFEEMLSDVGPENIGWYMRERMFRAAGYIKYAIGNGWEAVDIFKQGFTISLAERSYQGTDYHGRGLLSCYYSLGETEKCLEVYYSLKKENIFIAMDASTLFTAIEQPGFLPQPSPKLPAYIPELDFEDVPKIDINQYLVNNAYNKVNPW